MQRERKRGLVSLRSEREGVNVDLVVVVKVLGEDERRACRSCWTEAERARSSVKSSKSVGERTV